MICACVVNFGREWIDRAFGGQTPAYWWMGRLARGQEL